MAHTLRPSTAAHRRGPVKSEGPTTFSAAPRPTSASAVRPLSGHRNGRRSPSVERCPATRPSTATKRDGAPPTSRPPTAKKRLPAVEGAVPHTPTSSHGVLEESDGPAEGWQQDSSRKPTMRGKVASSRDEDLLMSIYRLCDEVGLGEGFTRTLQTALEAAATEGASSASALAGAASYRGVLEATVAELNSHKSVRAHVLRHIELRERVVGCMTLFLQTHINTKAGNPSRPANPPNPTQLEREELSALRRAPLSAVEQAEGESILISVSSCTQAVSDALDLWAASLARLGAEGHGVASRASSLAQPSVRVVAPSPETHGPRFAYGPYADYRRKMDADTERYARLRAVWGMPRIARGMDAEGERGNHEDSLAASTNSVASSVRNEILRAEAEGNAAIAIQRMWRAAFARMVAGYRRLQRASAVRIQRWYRRTTRLYYLTVRIGRERAVTTIQTAWRKSLQRRESSQREVLGRHARVIQRSFRAWTRHLHWQRYIERRRVEAAAASVVFRFLRRIAFRAGVATKIVRRHAAVKIQAFARRVWARTSNDVDYSKAAPDCFTVIVPQHGGLSQSPADASDLLPHFARMDNDDSIVQRRTPRGSGSISPFEASIAMAASADAKSVTSSPQQHHAMKARNASFQSQLSSHHGASICIPSSLLNVTRPVVFPSAVYTKGDHDERRNSKVASECEGELPEGDNDNADSATWCDSPLIAPHMEGLPPLSAGPLEAVPRPFAFPLACRRVRVLEPTSANRAPVTYDAVNVPSARLQHCFWRGDAGSATVIQCAFRRHRAVRAMLAKRAERTRLLTQREDQRRLVERVSLVQRFVRARGGSFVCSRKEPHKLVAAVRIQRWWRLWSAIPITVANRLHREYLLEEGLASIHGLRIGHSEQEARVRKQAAVRLSTWVKRHHDRRRRNNQAQRTLVRAWRHYLCQRAYCIKKYTRRLELARLAAAELDRLSVLEDVRRSNAALVIQHVYLQYRLRTLVQRLDRACEEVRRQPDRAHNAGILQRFWRTSLAHLEAMRGRRIAANLKSRTSEEERLMSAAIRVQTLYRQVLAKRRSRQVRDRIQRDRDFAATVIQRNVRMWLATRCTDEIRLGNLSMYREFRRLMTRRQWRTNQL